MGVSRGDLQTSDTNENHNLCLLITCSTIAIIDYAIKLIVVKLNVCWEFNLIIVINILFVPVHLNFAIILRFKQIRGPWVCNFIECLLTENTLHALVGGEAVINEQAILNNQVVTEALRPISQR